MNTSIVIPNYNGEKYIIECIDKIYDQIKCKRDIIVVDNNSSDQSVKLIKEKYPEITLITNHKNLGFADAVNIGIKYSDTEFVILLNNDAFAYPRFVSELYDTICEDVEIFSVSAMMLNYWYPHLIDNAGDQFCITGWAFK